MRKNTIRTYKLPFAACLMAAVMSFGCIYTLSKQSVDAVAQTGTTLSSEFSDPSDTARSMIRYWIPEAAVEESELRTDLQEIASLGYGGVEVVAMTTMTFGVTEEYRWGTANWDKAMTVIVDEAKKLGLTVDVTNGPAWPVAMPTISSPDDEGSCYEMTYSATYVSGGTEYSGTIPKKTTNRDGGTPQIISAYAYRVVGEKADKTLDHSSAVDLSPYLKLNEKNVTESTLTWTAPKGSDWEIMIFFEQPTAKTTNGYYVVDHFSQAGAEKCAEYWEEIIEEKEYLEYVGTIFLDSLEYVVDKEWTRGFEEIFSAQKGYDITSYLPVIGNYDGDNLFSTGSGSGFRFSDEDLTEMIKNDYNDVLTYCYTKNFLEPLQEMAERHGMTVRSQVAYNKPMSTVTSALSVGIPETETLNRASLDQQRLMAAAVHMTDKTIYSYESNAEMMPSSAQSQLYEDILYWQKRAWASGVNRQVLHGASYSGVWSGGTLRTGSDNEFASGSMDISWPGWNAMGNWTSNDWNRTTSAEHAKMYLDYMARYNYVMQFEAKIDVAVYYESFLDKYMCNGADGEDWYPDGGTLNSYGFSYEFVSPEILALNSAVVTDGVLNQDGPAYKAIVVHNQTRISSAGLNRLAALAEAGLKIVFVGETPSKNMYYSDYIEAGYSDANITDGVKQLLNSPNVVCVDDYGDVSQALIGNGVTPDAAYQEPCDLLATRRVSEEGSFYYLYNYNKISKTSVNASTVGKTDGTCYPFIDKSNFSSKTVTITLQGAGRPYYMNAWTGEITAITQYSTDGSSVTLTLDFAGDEAKLIALLTDEQARAAGLDVAETYVTAANGKTELLDGNLVLKASSSGDYAINLSNGNTVTRTVSGVQEAFQIEKWTLSLKTIGQGDTIYFRDSVWTTYDAVTLRTLRAWGEIQSEWLEAGGVGTYTASFELDEGWDEGGGTYINLGEVTDMFTVSVNGVQLSVPDQLNTVLDIGPYVQKGVNQITVVVATPIKNYSDADERDDYGLLGVNGFVTVTPYRTVTVWEQTRGGAPSWVLPICVAVGVAAVAGVCIAVVFAARRKSKKPNGQG